MRCWSQLEKPDRRISEKLGRCRTRPYSLFYFYFGRAHKTRKCPIRPSCRLRSPICIKVLKWVLPICPAQSGCDCPTGHFRQISKKKKQNLGDDPSLKKKYGVSGRRPRKYPVETVLQWKPANFNMGLWISNGRTRSITNLYWKFLRKNARLPSCILYITPLPTVSWPTKTLKRGTTNFGIYDLGFVPLYSVPCELTGGDVYFGSFKAARPKHRLERRRGHEGVCEIRSGPGCGCGIWSGRLSVAFWVPNFAFLCPWFPYPLGSRCLKFSVASWISSLFIVKGTPQRVLIDLVLLGVNWRNKDALHQEWIFLASAALIRIDPQAAGKCNSTWLRGTGLHHGRR
jgi:hypothetical protein